ncbi:NAD-dependent epimerase/dehydratase family protein [Sphingobium chungbukense]|uniref:NAD-dependent epimerase/dehydratase family protein n=1 Tax=Sphingobium chungbukense TaxID=56193 RepID=UPI000A021879|nr:NAD(P)-dependent oxidoreductase [Sphingobium chungbukense]
MTFTAHIAAALRHSEHRIVLTGASGWLGRATLDLLQNALGDAFAERVFCFGSRQAELRLSETQLIMQRPLVDLVKLPYQPTYLLHFAFLTKDRAETMQEADYCAANRVIRQSVLDALDPIGVEAAFIASSGAAQFADDMLAKPAMRLYGMLKREDEDVFAAWAEGRDKSSVIARIFNLSGPHINKLPSYALSSFILDALSGGPVIVQARHDVRRGYVAIRELMSLAFALLLERRHEVVRFDSGGDDIELGELASTIASQMNCSVERPSRGGGPADVYLGDDRDYRRLLDRHRIDRVSLAEQIDETAAFLKHASALGASQDSYA